MLRKMKLKKKKRPSSPPLGIPKTSSRSRVSKGPARDEKHLERVRSQPCIAINYGRHDGPVEAHHVTILEPRCMQRKPSDYLTVPLCRGHHTGFPHCSAHGQEGERMFWSGIQGIDPAAWIAAFSKEGRQAIEQLRGAS